MEDRVRRPRVAVDLRIADPPGMEHTGVGRYALEIARTLVAARPHWEFVLHSNRRDLLVGVQPTRWPTGVALGRIAWLHAGSFLTARQADVWVGTAFVLPAWWRGPSVVTIHDITFALMPERYRGRLNTAHATWATRLAARRADRVVCGSEQTRELLGARWGVDAGKVRVVPYGVADAFFAASAPQREDFWLVVGTFEPRKGLDVLEGALDRLDLPARVVLAGRPGWGTEEVVARLSNRPEVEVVLGPSDGELASLYARARGLVYPSRMEGFGLPVAEAMAAGTPVVCSDLPAIRGWAGDAPRYVPPGDADALAAALAALEQDESERAERGRRGQALAGQLRWRRVGEVTAAEIEAVLPEH